MDWYVNVDGKSLRRGFTTGTALQAAAKASALWQLTGYLPSKVNVILPIGKEVTIPIEKCELVDGFYFCTVKKDAGDDADITDGAVITSAVVCKDDGGISFFSTGGVGIVTEEGLEVPVGELAVNPVPRRMVGRVLKEFGIKNADVFVGVEDGERLAEKTLNPRLGIIGGISILGRTGIVEPMSESAWKESLLPEMKLIKVRGYDYIVFVPGGRGEKLYRKFISKDRNVVICGNYFGFAIREAIELGFSKITVAGSFQKIIKLAAGNFNTDSRVSDAKREVTIVHLLTTQKHYNEELVMGIMKISPFSKVIPLLEMHEVDVKRLFYSACLSAVDRLKELGNAKFRVIMFYRDTLLVDSGEWR